jgi:protocatechuate 3,4-dioxygenase alpha subunit
MTAEHLSPQVRGADESNDRRPGTPRRGSGFLDEPFQLGTTPSATVGPYLAIGLTWADGPYAVAEGTPGAIWLRGRVFDGNGDLVPDAMIESWQADPDGRFAHPDDPRGAVTVPGFRGFGRSHTVDGGEYALCTLKPGRVPDGEGGLQAPHVDLPPDADRPAHGGRLRARHPPPGRGRDRLLRGVSGAMSGSGPRMGA